jgi:ornithine cyclodeaminase/alanine dehydrogenase-like protein (mu-crystallin family)
VSAGTFIAAVGADSEEKQELDPKLVAKSKLIVDNLEQCAKIGELHHALESGLMTTNDVHAELGEVIAGLKPGRSSDDQTFIFDSTGTGIQDVAAAAIVYQNALDKGFDRVIKF